MNSPQTGPARRALLLSLAACSVSTLLAAATSARAADPAKESSGDWISLFNGKDLEGWTVKIRGSESGDNFGDTFRVEDGVLKVGYEKYDQFAERFGHIFCDKSFSNYRLRVEYRFTSEQAKGGPGWAFRNSGLMLHGQTPQSMTKDQKFPVSIEVQLLGGNGKDERPTANLCTPGTNVVMEGELITRHCTSSKSKTFAGDQWVTCEVEVRGGRTIKHYVNGDLVMEYEQPQLDPRDADAKKLIEQAGGELLLTHGTISLQSESHPVEFRKVELLVLDDE